jgi:hypothetical protein
MFVVGRAPDRQTNRAGLVTSGIRAALGAGNAIWLYVAERRRKK